MSRFPGSMKALKARFPKSERFIQLRIFNRDGDVIEFDGQLSLADSRTIMHRLTSLIVLPCACGDCDECLVGGLPSEDEVCDCEHRYKRGHCPFCGSSVDNASEDGHG